MKVDVRSFELPPIGTICYAVINEDTQQIAIFDAPLNAFLTVERLCVKSGLALDGLYLTHGHWDHTLDAHRFQAAGQDICAHAGDRELLENPACMSSFAIPGIAMNAVEPTRWLQHGEELQVAGRPVEIRHVPGHSAGSILFWFKEDGFAISGDAIFQRSVGRTDFPGCSFAVLERSIREQIYTLPASTLLYPGHGPHTTVNEESANNPFVRV